MSRTRELRADWYAAKHYGSNAITTALLKVHEVSSHFSEKSYELALNSNEQFFETYSSVLKGESSVLEKYKNYPELINEINGLQARIVFYPQGMLNPDSGIKIFRYTMVSKQDMTVYKEQIKALVQEAVSDMLVNQSEDGTPFSVPGPGP